MRDRAFKVKESLVSFDAYRQTTFLEEGKGG